MSTWQSLLLQGVVALVPAGGAYMLFTLKAQRRKLGADSAVGEATAAETLTGSALALVQHAEARAQRAETKADHAEEEAAEAHRMAMLAQQRLGRLITWIRTQGMDPPSWVEGAGD